LKEDKGTLFEMIDFNQNVASRIKKVAVNKKIQQSIPGDD